MEKDFENTKDDLRTGELRMHSKELEETAIWKYYREKLPDLSERCTWVKEVYKCCTEYLSYVNKSFANYTLHDKTHILNVLDAIGGLLGNRIKELTPGEAEVLILAASMHDLGMVYTDEEITECYSDERKYNRFARECRPELLGTSPEEWSDENKQWYLRTLHPFRIRKVLEHEEWKEILKRQPVSMVSMEYVLSVCQAHGETPNELHNNRNLTYLPADDTDILFCALLLRLGDLLDFDDTRAPRVLLNYAVDNEKSIKEIKKHRDSVGFSYPETPSLKELPYKAKCTEPGIERAIRDFLDWVDEELLNCSKLQKRCNVRWQEFPLPRAISREGIESDGYMNGDFCITMDQNQILKLLTGENLYDSPDVFVRELLQNAIDATLLRGKMDSSFKPESSRIDLWEWTDREGNTWFRIDDRGTGMTLGMLQRYFLKVGNSYYNSKELKRDLQDHGSGNEFYGISQFGIGFLSCFLCADYAEVSTLYFDEEKNRREEEITDSYAVDGFGLRMQVTGVSGYYITKNQAKGNLVDDPLPSPDWVDMESQFGIEKVGYRSKAGTSIVLRLDLGKLGSIDLQKSLEKYLCYPRVPVYYNNKKVGYTHDELMNVANEMAGKHVYELPPKYKEEFDRYFPAVAGQYPKLIVEVIPIDRKDYDFLSGFYGVLLKCAVFFDKDPQWKTKDLWFNIYTKIDTTCNQPDIYLETKMFGDHKIMIEWEELVAHYGSNKMNNIAKELDKYDQCPHTIECFGKIGEDIDERIDIYDLWRCYHGYRQHIKMKNPLVNHKYFNNKKFKLQEMTFSYQGVKSGKVDTYHRYNKNEYFSAIFLLEEDLKPVVQISRSNIINFRLMFLIIIHGIMIKNKIDEVCDIIWMHNAKWRECSLSEWREIMNNAPLQKWFTKNYKDFFLEAKQILEKALETEEMRV